jgi:hypothetical protein
VRTIKIMGHYKNMETEEVDEFSEEEHRGFEEQDGPFEEYVERMLSEYGMAFGEDWTLWTEEER